MTSEIKTFRFTDMQVKADGDAGTIEGYGSTFGGSPDAYGDIIAKGAFADSIAQSMPKMLYQHNSGMIAGVWKQAAEDNHGLYLKGNFINTPLSQQAREECKEGALDSMSIGFATLDADYDPKADIRTLKKVALPEVSLVTFPANANALISAAKSAPDNVRDFEEFLREAGYSREKAKIIATRGFKAIDTQREAEAEEAALATLYTDFFKAFHSNP